MVRRMTVTMLEDGRVSGDEERTLLLGVEYDAPTEKHLDRDEEIVGERERYDDQILAGLVLPW